AISPHHDLSFSSFFFQRSAHLRHLHSFPTRRSSDLKQYWGLNRSGVKTTSSILAAILFLPCVWQQNLNRSGRWIFQYGIFLKIRSEEHTSELQSRENLVCRLLLEKKKKETQDREE